MVYTLKSLVFVFLTSLSYTYINAACPTGNITLSSQAEVDAFSTTYMGCTSVDYNVVIGGPITNLDGLSGLTSVGGNLLLASSSIFSTNIDGLSSLTNVGGDLSIRGNSTLTNLEGLSGLTSVGMRLIIEENPALTNIDGLSGLANVGGNFVSIEDNDALTNIDGLSGLTTVGGDLIIRENDALTNLDGLSGLTNVDGDLGLILNAALTNIDGLSSLTNVGGVLGINANDNLAACCGVFPILDGTGVSGGFFFGAAGGSNLAGCNSEAEILAAGACIIPEPIPTMSQWSIFLMGLIMAIMGIVFLLNTRTSLT